MNILVTGSAGYIGASFAYKCLEDGHSVVGIDNYSNSSDKHTKILKAKSKDFMFIEADLSKNISNEIQKNISKKQIDIVVHFAALKSVSESEKLPMKYWDNNVGASINLINILKNLGIKKLIFSSSATVYGDSEIQPVTEECKMSPMSTYGSTKIACEYLFNDACKAGDLDVIHLRYFNPVGALKSVDIYDDPYACPANIMPRLVRTALGIEKHMYIWGNDYGTKDGTGARDYIHIADLVEGHISAMNFLKFSTGSLAFNLGTGNSITVLELIKKFETINNVKIPISFEKRRKGDIPECYADPTRAEMVLKWKTKKSLEEMCESSWMPFKK